MGIRRLVMLLVLAATLLPVSVASAQPRLPFAAYGSGVRAGAVIEAIHKDAPVAKATADAEGTWLLQVPADAAADGDVIAFRVDGRPARETVVFRSARFVTPPGLTLTVEGQSVQPPTAAATSTPAADVPRSGGMSAIVVAGAVLAALAAAGGAYALSRRGRQAPRD